MILKFILTLFLCLPIHTAMAQNIAIVNKEIQAIDSLIIYKQLNIAQKKADSLLLVLKSNSKQQTEQILAIRLLQATILEENVEKEQALALFLDVLEQTEKNKYYKLFCKTHILISLNQERTGNFDIAYKYINAAAKICKKYQLEELYSTIMIRSASLHRLLSNLNNIPPEQRQSLDRLGFKASLDSATYYTQQAIKYAEKYNDEDDLNDGYLLLGILSRKYPNKKRESINYFLKTIPYFKKVNDYENAAIMNCNIAISYLRDGDAKTALSYNDSAYVFYDKLNYVNKYVLPTQRSEIFKALNNMDSAYHYLQIARREEAEKYARLEATNAKRLEEQYQNDKKETTIKNKNYQILLTTILFFIIVIATILLMLKNRKINFQNNIISQQLIDLTKILEQKQMLLSELQHRVKNNLQYVISILEIQKESANFNNIDELIRSNQNRIHSMALLHKKLNVTESINEVNLEKYLAELSELVKKSYENRQKNIHLNLVCDIEAISITKTLPIGLIIVELVSNSMKHAFKNQNTGIINIKITKNENTHKHKLYYADNGKGFDFSITPKKGLGIEIIKGLIDQLDASIETQQDKGFGIIIEFK